VLARKNMTARHFPHEPVKRHQQVLHYSHFSRFRNRVLVTHQSLACEKKVEFGKIEGESAKMV